MLLAGMVKLVRDREYRFIGQSVTLHSFADLGQLQWTPTRLLRRFLAGQFTFELKGKRHSERMETVEGMTVRLTQQGAL